MSLHPVRTAVGAEHNRRHAFLQAIVLGLCLFTLSVIPASASDPGTAAVNLLPTNGKHRGIVLKSQTVDAIINEEQGKVWADTKVWLRLHNPASKPITVSVTLLGPQTASVPLPANLDVRVGKLPLRLLRSADQNGERTLDATAAIGIPARRSVDVRLAFRQALPEDHGVVTYAYPLAGADQWAGTPESLRVTVELKPPVAMRSVLATAPAAHRSDAQTLTWDWESEWGQSRTNVGLALMTPEWFAEFEAARIAATGNDAGAAQHILLGQHYRRLASLPAVSFDAQTAFRPRYYPAAIAELQTALSGDVSPIEKAQAHSMLVDLYLEEAEQAERGARQQYLQAAETELEAALGSSTPEPALVESATRVLSELSAMAEAAGDDATVRLYRQRLEAVRSSSLQQAAQARFAESDLAQAARALEQGDTEPARDLIESLYGPQAAVLPGASPPLVSHTLLTVTTTLESRQITVHLGGGQNLEDAAGLVRRTTEALRLQRGAQIRAAANTVTITLPEPPGLALFELQEALAAALPDASELSLLRSVLADTRGSAVTQASMLRSTWRYTERVDLVPAFQRWEETATQLESAQVNPLPELPPGQSDQLQRIQRTLWDSDAAAWHRFAASSRVDYRFEQSLYERDREWQVRAGESREMFVQNSGWNLNNIRWTALAVCVAVLGLAALVWRLA